MQIELMFMGIKDFKGIGIFTFSPDGSNVNIVAKNGLGKTSIADAFHWLFTNANSDAVSVTKFNIIPLDKHNNPLNHINPDVTAILKIDGEELTLRKVYKQKWTGKKGDTDRELTGHTTSYYWNKVPVSMRKYNDNLAEIIKPELFRSLFDVFYFCSGTKPEYRRGVLLDIIGDITDEVIINDSPELSELPEILDGHTISEHKVIVAEAKKSIDIALKELPVRINEKKRDLPNNLITPDIIAKDIEEIEKKIQGKRDALASLTVDDIMIEKKKASSMLYDELYFAKQNIIDAENEAIKQLENDKRKYSDDLDKVLDKIYMLKRKSIDISKRIAENESSRNELRDKWMSERQKIYEGNEICYACSQPLPLEMIHSMETKFNIEQANKLEKLASSGKQLKTVFDNMLVDAEILEAEISDANTQADELGTKLESTKNEIHAMNQSIERKIDKATSAIKEKIKAIEAEIKKGSIDTQPQQDIINAELNDLASTKMDLERQVLKYENATIIQDRINELTAELKNAGNASQRIKKELDLINRFVRIRASYIEKNVTDHFDITEWKMFDAPLQGQVKDICEPMVNGVPYSVDLNTGAKINVGLDVISTLSKHYGISAPVFVDNAESITDWVQTPSNQIIKMYAIKDQDLSIVDDNWIEDYYKKANEMKGN